MSHLTLNGYCDNCLTGSSITVDKPALSIPDEYKKIHFECLGDEHKAKYSEEIEEAKKAYRRWMSDIEPIRQGVKEKNSVVDKGRDKNLMRKLFGIFTDLFPNGPISKKTEVVKSIDLSQFRDEEKVPYSSLDNRRLYISPLGIGASRTSYTNAHYKKNFKALMLMWVYRREIVDTLHSYRDRPKKFLKFINAVDDVLDWKEKYQRIIGTKGNKVYDEIKFANMGLPETILLKNGNASHRKHHCIGLKTKRSRSSVYTYGVTESSSWDKIYWKPRADMYEAYKQVLPIADSMLDDVVNEIDEKRQKIDDKVSYVEREVQVYLAANII